MRFTLPTFAILLVFNSCQPPKFEGQVTYLQRVISKNDQVDEKLYNQIFGDTLRWTYKEGNYIEESNGSGSPKVIYLHSKNSVFTILPDSIIRRDVTLEEKPLDSLYFSGKQKTILGQPCRELVKIIKGVQHRFWITNKLPIEPANFSGYKLAHLNSQYNFAPFHYLRYEYESAVFKIEREAILIDQSPIASSLFELPDQGSLEH